MANQRKMRLCGGTFLVLLLDAKGKRQTTRRNGRKGDGRNNPDVFEKLLKLTIPDFIRPTEGRTFNTFTTEYKNCRESDTPSAYLTDAETIHLFDSRVRNNYQEVATAFDSFVKYAVDIPTHGKRLVASLLDMIDMDDIPGTQEFYIRADGTPVCRDGILNEKQYHLSSFILGVWHYIVCNVTDNENAKCKATIEYLLGPKGEVRAGREVNCSIGIARSSEINVTFDLPYSESVDTGDDEEESTDIYPADKAPLILGADGVAPDLANLLNGDIYMVERVLLEDEPLDEIFGTYLERVVEFYSKVKTLLYAEAPRNFGDFYVPNEVIVKTATYSNRNPDRFKGEVISNVIDAICNPHRDIVVRGTGGIGKSMMMRYLLLHFAEHYEQCKLLPVLAPLKNYTENEIDLESFIFRSVREFDRDLNFDDFEPLLKRGECLILLDGLDEIPTAARRIFEKQLIAFRKAYNNNCTVVSSRPTTSFVQFGPFRVLEIQPFSKEKALELIDKLDYHDAEAKTKFRMDLDRRLYASHKQFASNPLLLTIMLMTYTSYGDVPAKQHLFYAKAYETMARLHDASKGAYVRPMHTNLSPEDFAVYFAEFSARTYKAEILEFDERVFTEHMAKTIKHQGKKIDATPRDFLLDLTDNLCIMYKEGEKYYYIHRSFQEYFSAVFFANQMDDQLERIGMFFEERRWRMSGDKTFWMLWDMIQTRVDKFIFLPYLKRLWAECDDNDGYWTFLEKAYPIVYAYEGEPGESCENEPELYLYTIISSEATRNHGDELGNLDWPGTIDFCNRKEWATIEKPFFSEDGKRGVRYEAIEFDRIDEDYIDMNGEPELEGVSWEIHISDLMKRRDFFQDLIEFMEDDSFPLMKEYREMREFTEWLDKKINSKPSSDDWFDAF